MEDEYVKCLSDAGNAQFLEEESLVIEPTPDTVHGDEYVAFADDYNEQGHRTPWKTDRGSPGERVNAMNIPEDYGWYSVEIDVDSIEDYLRKRNYE